MTVAEMFTVAMLAVGIMLIFFVLVVIIGFFLTTVIASAESWFRRNRIDN